MSASLLDRVLRMRYLVFVGLTVLLFVVGAQHLPKDNDWQFFTWGSDVLFGAHRDFVRSDEVIAATGGGGLHIYGDYPFLQIGPLPLLLTRGLEFGPREGLYLAEAAVYLLVLVIIAVLDRAIVRSRVDQATLLLGGGCLVVVWVSLAQSHHLDDALALSLLAAAILALKSDRTLFVGASLGLAAASKPWAVPVVALALALPTWRQRLTACIASAFAILACWGPFLVADRRTVDLGQLQLSVAASSSLRALGVQAIGNSEEVRLAQFLIGLALAVLLVALGTWYLAPLAAFAVRLALEPFPYQYYMASIVTAALIADLRLRRGPLFTTATAGMWICVAVVSAQTASRVQLVGYCVLVVACVVAGTVRRARDRGPVSC